jgi:hypothetical protein
MPVGTRESLARQLHAIAVRDADRQRTLDAIRAELLADAQIPIRSVCPTASKWDCCDGSGVTTRNPFD